VGIEQWAVGNADQKDNAKAESSLKLLTVMNEDLDRTDLENVLLQCLVDAPKDEEDDPNVVSAAFGHASCKNQSIARSFSMEHV
jgi:hypothetical protein